MPTGIDIDTSNGGVDHMNMISKPAFMFKIHPYSARKNKIINRECSKCDGSQSTTTCDCNSSPLSSPGAMKEKEWNVERVHEIPSYFCIERSHEYYDNLTPSEISRRISDCLSAIQDSFTVKYDNDEAVAYVESIDKTKSDYCKFHVRIYKAINSTSILVECQRRTGCCIKFHSMAMKVLCAARGCEYKEECFHAYTIGKDVLEQCRLNSLSVAIEATGEAGVGLDCDGGPGTECDCRQYAYLAHEYISESNEGTF